MGRPFPFDPGSAYFRLTQTGKKTEIARKKTYIYTFQARTAGQTSRRYSPSTAHEPPVSPPSTPWDCVNNNYHIIVVYFSSLLPSFLPTCECNLNLSNSPRHTYATDLAARSKTTACNETRLGGCDARVFAATCVRYKANKRETQQSSLASPWRKTT